MHVQQCAPVLLLKLRIKVVRYGKTVFGNRRGTRYDKLLVCRIAVRCGKARTIVHQRFITMELYEYALFRHLTDDECLLLMVGLSEESHLFPVAAHSSA
jgi:hypothetical protein